MCHPVRLVLIRYDEALGTRRVLMRITIAHTNDRVLNGPPEGFQKERKPDRLFGEAILGSTPMFTPCSTNLSGMTGSLRSNPID